jgi:folate-dependent phosphoribosylglycinamide formyltransferase PurN
MRVIKTVRHALSTVRRDRPWERGHARLLLRSALGSSASQHDDLDHLRAAATWLAAAQDSQPDGGISGRYRLDRGWTSSYPETTGYAIPTLLSLADTLDDEKFRKRAETAIDFLLSIQLASGAFPGREIAENATEPSPFNTAQIVHGLLAWHRATGDGRSLNAARRGADWLLSVQEPDGSWAKYFYLDVSSDYSAHLSCWVAELGAYTGEDRYLDAASRHLDSVLGHYNPETGWFQRAGFYPAEHAAGIAPTHTIAYTIWGVLFTSEILEREDGIEAARHAARRVARRIELRGSLPGFLDSRWRARNTAVCLTGNCQMALIWMRLYNSIGDATLLNAAFKAIDEVKTAQDLDNPNSGIRGGIPGSFPVWGEYISNALPNWAAKYFIDALLAKQKALANLAKRPRRRFKIPQHLPQHLPAIPSRPESRPQRIVLVTGAGSSKAQRLIEAWRRWDFVPASVIVERPPATPVSTRLAQILQQEGIGGITRRLPLPGVPRRQVHGPDKGPSAASSGRPPASIVEFCAGLGIPTLELESLTSQSVLSALEAIQPDLLVHAGAGIIRRPLLATSRLGMINAHMGILPFYRGMNVAEWAAFNGDPVGCSVHLIDDGIDTGDIIIIRPVDASHVDSTASLRALVDDAQIDLLGEVVRYVASTGESPPRYPQDASDGRQFFTMHPEIRRVLETELDGRSRTDVPRDPVPDCPAPGTTCASMRASGANAASDKGGGLP